MDPAAFRGDAARIAFWINTYNERLLGFLAERPRSGHLFRHRRLFRRETFEIGGLAYTLDVIEHGLLRLQRPSPLLPRAGCCAPATRGCAQRRRSSTPESILPSTAEPAPAPRCVATGDRIGKRARPRSPLRRRGRVEPGPRARELELPGVIKIYRADFGPDEELIELAATSIGGADGEWIREHRQELRSALRPLRLAHGPRQRIGSSAMGLALVILIVIVVVLALAALLIYNRMVARRNAVDNSWAQIEAALKRRHDLIPNLVEAVRGYAKHEQQTFENVTRARSTAVKAEEVGPAPAGRRRGRAGCRDRPPDGGRRAVP